ncbi:MAG: YdiU family protein [Myxococcales bacterium]|nr:YdiU family protein [Myxococcales bacterium]
MPIEERYQPSPRLLELGESFYDPVRPARFPKPTLRFRNDRWAARVGLADLDAAEWEAHFARFEPLPENLPGPLAMRYHGHQFQMYNPNLGDGRGFTFAQMIETPGGRLLDFGTKGSGTTPYSRGGDGKLTLKGGVRETLAAEMLEALGVDTSKTFSLFETGESLWRHDEPSPTRAAVLVRLSHSHIRFGTFQRHAYHRATEDIRRLIAFCAEHYLPELRAVNADDLPARFLEAVTERAADLAASWMAAGFVHGVLNTDNMNVTGESFDYGPYRFLPTFDPTFVAAYFDPSGLYAFGRQPSAVLWSLEQLAECLTPLTSRAALAAALEGYPMTFDRRFRRRVVERLGLNPTDADLDSALVEAAYRLLAESQVGYERFFFDWYAGSLSEARALAGPVAEKYQGEAYHAFRRALDKFEPAHPERLEDPYFQSGKPCTLLIDEIEWIWEAIAEKNDWSRFERKIDAIRRMGAALGNAPE